jgi:hypothetical protein
MKNRPSGMVATLLFATRPISVAIARRASASGASSHSLVSLSTSALAY